MKICVVPAQITTVEDTITGSLTLNQLFLLIAPVFTSGLIFILLPPFMSWSLYKFVLIGVSVVIFSALAIRIKGTLLVFRLLILARYNIRPRYYIYNKNDMYMRLERVENPDYSEADVLEQTAMINHFNKQKLSLSEYVKLDQFMNDPAISMRFQPGKKGGIDVLIAEVER